MKGFLLGSLSSFCFASACLVLVASGNFVLASTTPSVPCSIPPGGCQLDMSDRCIGACTDNNVGDGVACACRHSPMIGDIEPVNPCICWAYLSNIG